MLNSKHRNYQIVERKFFWHLNVIWSDQLKVMNIKYVIIILLNFVWIISYYDRFEIYFNIKSFEIFFFLILRSILNSSMKIYMR